MPVITQTDGMIQLALKGVDYTFTQDEFDHLMGLMIPFATPKERYIFALFQKMDADERDKIGMLLKP